MDWVTEIYLGARLLLACTLGGAVGWERELHGRVAGIRTYAAVSVGACAFALIAALVPDRTNPHVIASGVVTGIGFLGAGVILREKGEIVGLTTAATLWATASSGLAVGYGMCVVGFVVAIVVFCLLAAHHLPFWRRLKPTSPNSDISGSADCS